MKILLFTALLAITSFAYVNANFKGAATDILNKNKQNPKLLAIANQVIELNAKQKKEFAEEVIKDLNATEDKKCMEELKPVLLDTSVKYLKKIFKGEAFYEKEGKEFKFSSFVQHSKAFKTATSDKCLRSMVNGIGKAAKKGVTLVLQGIVLSG